MTQLSRTARTRGPHRLAKAAVVFSIVFGVMFAGAGAAFAETDTLASQCIYSGGYQRGCASDIRVSWGSGLHWSVSGTVKNTYRYDGWEVVLETQLNRKWSSNTYFMQVSRALDAYYPQYWIFGSASGYDPTYGAWVRLCIVNTYNNNKYCNASRYVSDNS
jgi:hypothetical protein